MQINKNCKLFLRDVYSYDISSCHYSILQKYGYDVSTINFENKEERNITIGKLMASNSRISSLLRTTTNSIIDFYMHSNNINNDDLITRQYDGIITSKPLRNTSIFLNLELKNIFNVFIISIDRTKYLATDYKEYAIKGISNRYDGIDSLYKKLLNINYSSRNNIFESLKNIKFEVLNSYDPFLYCIPHDNKYNVFLKDFGQIEISKSLSKIFNLDELDREWYFNNYLRQFTESITIEFL